MLKKPHTDLLCSRGERGGGSICCCCTENNRPRGTTRRKVKQPLRIASGRTLGRLLQILKISPAENFAPLGAAAAEVRRAHLIPVLSVRGVIEHAAPEPNKSFITC